jgi:hypothetical protein
MAQRPEAALSGVDGMEEITVDFVRAIIPTGCIGGDHANPDI